MKRLTIISMIILFSLAAVFAANKPAKVTVPLTFDEYYTYETTNLAVKALHEAYPGLTKLDLVGKSEEGRLIYCLTINNPKTGKELNKPGVWVDANIHGNEIQGTDVVLYMANYLLTKYNTNKTIKTLVDKNCFYIIPVVNPDGRYHFMNDAGTPNNNRGLRRPHDDDHDGLLDEDYPDDLDGDGNICRMRKKDPNGNFKTDPEDPRLMIRCKPGEKGEWIMLGQEGIDNDGDGMVNEDAEGYVDPNRNWGFDWSPPYVQSGAGDYPFSGVGLKAIALYFLKRTNICITWSFHNTGGMWLRGPSRKALGMYPREDVEVYDYIGYQAERATPGYEYMVSWSGLYSTYGDSMEFMTMLGGTYGFVGELYMTSQEKFRSLKETKKKEKMKSILPDDEDDEDEGFFSQNQDFERERLKFNDHLAQGEMYKEWKPFNHPTYGKIEIGGWVKMSTRLPTPFMIKDMVHRNAAAVIFSAKHTPEITINVLGTKKIGDNLTRIRLRLSNAKAMPTMTYKAKDVKLYPQDMLTVKGKDIKVVAGGKLLNIYRDQVTYKEFRPELQFLTVPGFGKVDYQFLVTGKGTVTIKYQSRHAGIVSKTINIQ